MVILLITFSLTLLHDFWTAENVCFKNNLSGVTSYEGGKRKSDDETLKTI